MPSFGTLCRLVHNDFPNCELQWVPGQACTDVTKMQDVPGGVSALRPINAAKPGSLGLLLAPDQKTFQIWKGNLVIAINTPGHTISQTISLSFGSQECGLLLALSADPSHGLNFYVSEYTTYGVLRLAHQGPYADQLYLSIVPGRFSTEQQPVAIAFPTGSEGGTSGPSMDLDRAYGWNIVDAQTGAFDGWRVRDSQSGKVYFVLDGVLRWIPNSDSYNALFRDWNNIQDIKSTTGLTEGPPLIAHLASGKSVNNPMTSATYLFDDVAAGVPILHPMTDAVFDRLGFNRSAVTNAGYLIGDMGRPGVIGTSFL